MRKGLVIAALVIGVQAATVAVYLAARRSRGTALDRELTVERLDPRPAPALAIERPDGTRPAAVGGQWTLVHFWATWCRPCRAELPTLLAVPKQVQGLRVVAVSVDAGWGAVRSYFEGRVPDAVVLSTEAEAARWGATTLPDTYLVSPTGEVVARYFGARDWGSEAARRHLVEVTARPGR
jgi:thiol-disulfide isomerase/thioredoxin